MTTAPPLSRRAALGAVVAAVVALFLGKHAPRDTRRPRYALRFAPGAQCRIVLESQQEPGGCP